MIVQPKPQRVIDPRYRQWIKSEGCFAGWALTRRSLPGLDPGPESCRGPVDPHHAIPKGHGKTGSKVSDRRCIPACQFHHELAERQPDLFRDLFEELIVRLNLEYAVAFPPKPKTQKQKPMRVRLTVTNCALCLQAHSVGAKERGHWKDHQGHVRDKFWCKNRRDWVKEQ